MHDLPYVVTGGTAIGILPTPIQINKRIIGQRGKDKQTRRPKRCSRCVENGGRYAIECSAKAGEVLFIASIMMKTIDIYYVFALLTTSLLTTSGVPSALIFIGNPREHSSWCGGCFQGQPHSLSVGTET
eukprot:scaffold39251_cov77-Cyclotella_meneghiniana.AAC.2